MHLRIGKNPKLLEDKFDGPDVYSTIDSLASELLKLPLTIQSKIDSEKASVQLDFDKYKSSMQNKMNKMKEQWVAAFKEMKTVLYKSIQHVKNDISTV